MTKVIKVIQVGMGPIGRESARAIRLKKLKLVGAVDINPSLKGMDLKKFIGGKPGIKINDNLRRVLKNRKPDTAVVTTTSLGFPRFCEKGFLDPPAWPSGPLGAFVVAST